MVKIRDVIRLLQDDGSFLVQCGAVIDSSSIPLNQAERPSRASHFLLFKLDKDIADHLSMLAKTIGNL